MDPESNQSAGIRLEGSSGSGCFVASYRIFDDSIFRDLYLFIFQVLLPLPRFESQ